MDIDNRPIEPIVDFGEDPEEFLEEVTEKGEWIPDADSWLTPEILRKKAYRTTGITDEFEIL